MTKSRVTLPPCSPTDMGLCFQTLDKGPKVDTSEEYNLANGWVWMVIRRDVSQTPTAYHMQGVAADEELAVEMCIDEHYLIGPLPVNQALPHDKIEWIGAYFPLRGVSE